MKIINRSNRVQTFGGIELQPGEVWDGSVIVKPDPLDHGHDGRKGGSKPKAKRGRPPKGA